MKQHLLNVYIFLMFISGNIFSQVTSEQIHYGASSLSMAASDIALPKLHGPPSLMLLVLQIREDQHLLQVRNRILAKIF